MKALIFALTIFTCLQVDAQENVTAINVDEVLACPRCRRAQPPGPRKLPTPNPQVEFNA